ncbi:MAG: 50S ribosomal protein L9 [Gammaproteobacteria bacterium]|nr:50S ribosomal protein L9 [Gammaproteobacteria bacterium]
MEVILLEKVHNLGDLGAKVKVKPGYARNFLLPKGKAAPATADNLAKFEQMRADLEKKAAGLLTAAKARAEILAKLVINVPMRASDEGKLFGSVGPREIVIAITALGHEVDKGEVILPEGPIHALGEVEINLHLHSDVNVPVKVSVVAA